jgi:TonB family protein
MAQGGKAWVKVSPSGEQFTVQMPGNPSKKTQKNVYGDLRVDGQIYTAVDGDAGYAVWSFKNTNYSNALPIETDEYLDACADLVWESLLKPRRDMLPQEPNIDAHMAYAGELTGTTLPGREYSITLDTTTGVTNFYVSGERIYILMVLNAPRNATETERFLKSFTSTRPASSVTALPPDTRSKSTLPSATNSSAGVGIGPGLGQSSGGAGNVTGDKIQPAPANDSDPNRVYNTREVTQKARILTRPEPVYTESARKYRVTGTVVLRAVFSKTGEVVNIKVTRKLPHGLTKGAIMAARSIKFIPAVRDGRDVSQYIQIEYNFNLY